MPAIAPSSSSDIELASLYAIACCLLVCASGEAVRFELCEELLVNEGLLQMKDHFCRGLKVSRVRTLANWAMLDYNCSAATVEFYGFVLLDTYEGWRRRPEWEKWRRPTRYLAVGMSPAML